VLESLFERQVHHLPHNARSSGSGGRALPATSGNPQFRTTGDERCRCRAFANRGCRRSSYGSGAGGADGDGRIESPEIAGTVPTGASSESIDVEAEEVVRIPIPAELESWFESDPGLLESHEKLEREPRDSEWAQQLEADFRDFINSKSNLLDIKVLSVECRSSSCEILAVGYGDGSFRTWMMEMSELFVEDTWLKERFGGGPGEGGCGGGNIVPGIMGLIRQLQYRPSRVPHNPVPSSGSHGGWLEHC